VTEPERDNIGVFISHAFELTASDLAVYYPIDDLNGPCPPAVQGLFREDVPAKADRKTRAFVTDCGEILSLPERDGEYPGAFLNPRMKSALVSPVSKGRSIQGILFLNSLYEGHYTTRHIKALDEHSRIDRLRLHSLKEALG
jgi:hypothetical protein